MHLDPPLLLLLLSTVSFLPIAASSENNANATTISPRPAAVRGLKKMTDDEGEKFFFSYWDITNSDDSLLNLNNLNNHNDWTPMPNRTDPPSPPPEHPDLHARVYYANRPPFPTDPNDNKAGLFRRDFKCPADTRQSLHSHHHNAFNGSDIYRHRYPTSEK
ncbi:hypothetical protein FE257_012165 [Aspergillus nanangensis]|uniref:Uncharacterized protein n=1 Tax=Aspergillus nanangensis TaxID=2582783 RepID=A0AAD4GQZ0_ASPNN|nr:hypothetical protein FE257_012165 [Aspergillus nanangensis]